MYHGIAQFVGFNLMVNHRLTAPARRTAGQVCFAIAIGIKQSGQLRIFQLLDVGDVILIGGFLVDQITLGAPLT